jgi:hypothetical protein
MPEKRAFDKILGREETKNYTEERQLTAQSFALHVDYRDRLKSEGVAWSHFGRYEWKDLGDHERLRIVFGPSCALEIRGHNLNVLVAKIREGQLKGIAEDITSAAQLAVHEGTKEPVILEVSAYPDFERLFEEIKEEAKEGKDGPETGFAKRVRG